MPFAVPILWWELTGHFTDCYFYMVPPVQKGITKMKKWSVEYPNIPLTIRHCEGLPIPELPDIFPPRDCDEE